jgi:hypothetical protein
MIMHLHLHGRAVACWALQTAARVTPSELLQHFKLKRATTAELASDLVFFYHA